MNTLKKICAATNVFIACLLLFASCGRPACKIACQNGGTCNDDRCICPPYAEGLMCETFSRQKFTGNFQVQEDGSNTPPANFIALITASTAGSPYDAITLSNFHDLPIKVEAHVRHDSLEIPLQTHNGREIAGYGWYRNGTLYIAYQVSDSGGAPINDFGYAPNSTTSPAVWSQ